MDRHEGRSRTATLLGLARVHTARPLAITGMLVGLCACGPVGSTPTAHTPTNSVTTVSGDAAHSQSKAPMVAQVSVTKENVERDADVEVAVLIENRSKDQEVVLMAEELSSPAALFEVRDAMGKSIPPTSPPAPSGSRRVVAPGQAINIKMTLAGMFSPPLKPGEYSVRLRRIDSSPRRFRIASP